MQWDKSERNTSEKSTFQTSPNWRTNLPRLEDVLFQCLGAWRIIFFYFRNRYLKIHTQRIPKMSDFYVFGPFLAEKMALEVKKARFNPFVLPSDFFKSDGDPVYFSIQNPCRWHSTSLLQTQSQRIHYK